MIRAFKYRIYPTKIQEMRLAQSLETHRRLYNDALAERKSAYEKEKRSVSYYEQNRALTAHRKTNPWLGAENSNAEQRTLRRLDAAFSAFFRRVKAGEKPGYPRFRSRNRFDSFEHTYGNGLRLKGNRIEVKNVGAVKVRLDRPANGTIKAARIKREADGWYVVFTADIGPAPIVREPVTDVGIDVGLKAFAVTSGGDSIANPRYYRNAEKALRRAQRKVARRKKGSHRRRKAVALLAKVHQKVARQRLDFHHRTAKSLVARYDMIYHESLNIEGLGRSRLAKSVHDAGWGQFLFMLAYKAEEAGKRVVGVDPRNTTQVCNACGALPDERLTLADRTYRCAHCGYVADRDVNAARNILSQGKRATVALQALTPVMASVA